MKIQQTSISANNTTEEQLRAIKDAFRPVAELIEKMKRSHTFSLPVTIKVEEVDQTTPAEEARKGFYENNPSGLR